MTAIREYLSQLTDDDLTIDAITPTFSGSYRRSRGIPAKMVSDWITCSSGEVHDVHNFYSQAVTATRMGKLLLG
jgi:hypothetical protein